MRNATETLYRQVAAEGATYIGLLIVVYDSLAEDLRRAGLAVAANDISTRCTASNHALLLLGHLESWAASLEDLPLKASLTAFYSYLRSSILTLQTRNAAEPFHELAGEVTGLRATWQHKEFELRLARIKNLGGATARPSLSDDASDHRSRWSA